LTKKPTDTASQASEVPKPPDVYFLDANVLMYAIGRDHPYKAPCIEVLRQIEQEAIRVASSVEVLQEILHRYRSLREYEVAATAFTQFKALCEDILPVEPGDVDRAFLILEETPELAVRDAIHAATMHHHGLKKILSTDTHFDLLEQIARVDPRVLSPRPQEHTPSPMP